jgi:hypothetical protein
MYTIIWTLVTSTIGLFAGFMGGMLLTQFSVLSLRIGGLVGYEANGFFLSLVGLSLGGFLGAWSSQKILKQKGQKMLGAVFALVGLLFNFYFSETFIHFLFPVGIATVMSLYGFYMKNIMTAFLKLK